MTTLREAAQQALEALTVYDGTNGESKRKRVLATLRAALAKPNDDYERGFIDGMKKQAQSSVDKAVNGLALPTCKEDLQDEPVAGVVLNEEGRPALVEHGQEDWHCANRKARRLYTHSAPQRQPQKPVVNQQMTTEPVAKVELMTTGGNAGLATRIVEIDDHLRERLRPGQMLYTHPAPQLVVNQQMTTESVAWLIKWANQDDGKPLDDWEEGYEAARRVVKAHLDDHRAPHDPSAHCVSEKRDSESQEPQTLDGSLGPMHFYHSSQSNPEKMVRWDASAPLVMTPHPAFQRITQRQPLTQDEAWGIWDALADRGKKGEDIVHAFARAIEKAHGITGETK